MSRRTHKAPQVVSGTVQDEEITLRDLTFTQLRRLGIGKFYVYGADNREANADGFTQLKPVSDGRLRGQETPPFRDFLHQTLIVLPSHSYGDQFHYQHRFPTPEHVSKAITTFFEMNCVGKPMQIQSRFHNPWEFDDFAVHMPYYALTEKEKHNDEHVQRGDFCCLMPDPGERKNPQDPPIPQRNEDLGDLHKYPIEQHKGFCFKRKAVTICLYDHSLDLHDEEGNIGWGNRLHKNAQNTSPEWTALMIGLDPLSGLYKKSERVRFCEGRLPPSARNTYKDSKGKWKENQRGDFFQTRLVEITLRHICGQWDRTIDEVEKRCDDLVEVVRRRMRGDKSYWGAEVDYDVQKAHRLSTGLEVLENSIKDIIGNDDDTGVENGVWKKFRDARVKKRIDLLQNDVSPIKKGLDDLRERERTGKLNQDGKDGMKELSQKEISINTEVNRLRHLTYELCEVHRERLFSIESRLRRKREVMINLRQLLIDISQTRAALYANQLGDHVKYLTYVSILFLPLSFCTALWSMNYDLHPKNVFIVTASLTVVLTVVLLLILLHQHHKQSVHHRQSAEV